MFHGIFDKLSGDVNKEAMKDGGRWALLWKKSGEAQAYAHGGTRDGQDKSMTPHPAAALPPAPCGRGDDTTSVTRLAGDGG